MTMRKIRIITEEEKRERFEYSHDVTRIVEVLAAAGYDSTAEQAKLLWEKYSDSMCAGWMMLPYSDEEIVWCVQPYFEAVDGQE